MSWREKVPGANVAFSFTFAKWHIRTHRFLKLVWNYFSNEIYLKEQNTLSIFCLYYFLFIWSKAWYDEYLRKNDEKRRENLTLQLHWSLQCIEQEATLRVFCFSVSHFRSWAVILPDISEHIVHKCADVHTRRHKRGHTGFTSQSEYLTWRITSLLAPICPSLWHVVSVYSWPCVFM